MKTREQWVASILEKNNIAGGSESYLALEKKLIIIFEKASIKVKEDYHYSSIQQAIAPSLLTMFLIGTLGYDFRPGFVATNATLDFAKFLVGAGMTILTREVTNFLWLEEDIIAAPFFKKTLAERLTRPQNDTSHWPDAEWLNGVLDKLSTELPNLGCKTSFFKSVAVGLFNGTVETQLSSPPGVGVFIGSRLASYGNAVLTKFS